MKTSKNFSNRWLIVVSILYLMGSIFLFLVENWFGMIVLSIGYIFLIFKIERETKKLYRLELIDTIKATKEMMNLSSSSSTAEKFILILRFLQEELNNIEKELKIR